MNLNRRSALGVLGALGACAARVDAGQGVSLPPSLPTPGPGRGGVRGRMTGAKAAVEALCLEGARCVFGVPGAQNNEFWDALKSHGLPYFLVTHESSASIMADAWSRVTGEVGTFAVVPGPGITNALTGIGEALYDSVPIVGIVTDVDRRPGAPVGQVHGLANSAILRPVCKAVLEVRHPGQIAAAIQQAFAIARCGEPGPAVVVVPYVFYSQTWDYDDPPPPSPPYAFDEGGYRKALCVLRDRRLRVGIYAGMGCAGASPSLAAVAEVLQAPVATTVSGKGVVSDGHPLAVGWGYGAQATRAAEETFAKDVDVVLAIGTRFSENSTANYAVPRHDQLIHVDANPHNLGRNVPTDVAVCADSRLFLDRLLMDAEAVRRPARPDLWRKVAERRRVDRCSYHQAQITNGVDPMVFLVQLRQAMGPDDLMFVDVTASSHWAAEAVEVCGPRRFFTPANNQSMGWAIPASIGGQRARPDLRVAAVTGDGCFLMSGLEASTAAREGLPVKFFVLDDGTYHYMQMLQLPTYKRTTATEIVRLDFGGMAAGLRLFFNCIGDNADIAAGIARAFACPGPVLTQVRISYEGRDIRWLQALKSSYIDRLSTQQKVRMGARVAARSLNRHPDSD